MIALSGVYAGRIQPLGEAGRRSAIDKQPIEHGVAVDSSGLKGDQQADPNHHGGAERALLHYCADHYAAWARELPQAAGRFRPPGFGENLSSHGLDEWQVRIGDILRIGSVLLQVSQPRSPCWKLNHRFGVEDMARRAQDNARCGWFYRVLEPGRLACGDGIELIERSKGPSVAEAIRACYGPEQDEPLLERLAGLDSLSPNWRAKAAARLASGGAASAAQRLEGGD
ncbi:MOSC domain-containing protein [Thiohalobacter sp. IOR34]|uniref:MOSC domain-containing protein n=1 Tax=Thiohalobacter sp. IOR34 TaxID=3057176 RepID=UPI0025AFB503|nr:MOSC domain-containing protein [Thiohalobacter sp. IOR34]WJW75331.1 MOSC domain-containing protein [Thiohalobacter sp. IOR34]